MIDLGLYHDHGYQIFRDYLDGMLCRSLRYYLADEPDGEDGHFPLQTRLSHKLLAPSHELSPILKTLWPGERILMHNPPMARRVVPNDTAALVPAHQDVSYNRHLDGPFVSVWIPLTPIDAECGGVRLYRKTGRLPELLQTFERNPWLPALATDMWDSVTPAFNVGDVLLFSPYLIHESMPNQSERPRYSLDYRFFPASTTTTKHALDIDSGEVVKP